MNNTWTCSECGKTNYEDINPCPNCNNFMSFGQEFPLWLKSIPESPGSILGFLILILFFVGIIYGIFFS